MEWQQPKIVVVEGPAGSGKSTIIKRLTTVLGEDRIQRVANSLPRKDITDVGGVIGSMVNDYQKGTQALMFAGSNNGRQMIVIDRLIISQWVYHQLRTKEWSANHSHLRPQFIEQFGHIRRDLYFRSGQAYLEPKILVVMALPNKNRLAEQREHAIAGGRHYDYDLHREHELYTRAADMMRTASVHGLRYEDLTFFQVNGTEDAIERIIEWQWPTELTVTGRKMSEPEILHPVIRRNYPDAEIKYPHD